MSILTWRPATREDRGALSVFECTERPVNMKTPPYSRVHDRPWELEVQSWLRSLEPPRLHCGRQMWVGCDDEGLAAVVVFEPEGGRYSEVFVNAAGVALRRRYEGGGIADEMFSTLIDEVTGRAVQFGLTETRLTGHVFRLNSRSQAAARRNGLRHTASDGDHQIWQMVLEHPTELLQLAMPDL